MDEQAISEAAQEAVEEIEPTSELGVHLLGHLSCELESAVEVDGDEAVVVAHVSNVDLSQAIEEAYEQLAGDAETFTSLGDLYQEEADTDEEFFGIMRDVIYEHIDSSTALVQSDVELRFSKEGNTWTLDEQSAEDFARAAYAGLESGAK